MAAINARAKAEAAPTRAAFAKKQIAMKVEKTRSEPTSEVLQQQCNAEAAIAEANIYEAAASELEEEHISRCFPQSADPVESCSEYVNHHFFVKDKTTPQDIPGPHRMTKNNTFFHIKPEPDTSAAGHEQYRSTSKNKDSFIPHFPKCPNT